MQNNTELQGDMIPVRIHPLHRYVPIPDRPGRSVDAVLFLLGKIYSDEETHPGVHSRLELFDDRCLTNGPDSPQHLLDVPFLRGPPHRESNGPTLQGPEHSMSFR